MRGKACSKLGLHYVRDLPLNLTCLTTTISISRVGEVVTDPLPLRPSVRVAALGSSDGSFAQDA